MEKGPDSPAGVCDVPHPRSITRRAAVGMIVAAARPLHCGCGGPSAPSTSSTLAPPRLNQQPTPSGPVTNATLAVSAAAAGTVPSAFAGLSYEKSKLNQSPYLFEALNSNLDGIFRRLGPSLLRIGGNSVDRNVWTATGTGQTAGQIAPADVDAVAGFLKAAGWQCLYGINLGGAGPNPYSNGSGVAATTAALAADEIAYVYSKFGSSLMGFEIGNECDLYGSSYFSGTRWNLAAFENLWRTFRNALVARTPEVGPLCTGPADAGQESSWTVPFGQAVTKSKISLLTQHYYRANGADPSSTAPFLITPDTNLADQLSILKTGAHRIGLPFRIAECLKKDSTQNLRLTAQLPQTAASATLLQMTQRSNAATAPDLTATGGVTIQGASRRSGRILLAGSSLYVEPDGV